jgi:hypothetical protein
MPKLVTIIGNYAFHGCTSLTTINIPKLVTTIRDGVFNRCTSSKTIIIPNLVTTIGNAAFLGCTSLSSIIIPDQVTSIGHDAFYRCTSLLTINITNQVTTIGRGAFLRCTSSEQRQVNGNNYHANTQTWLCQRVHDLPLHQACHYNNKDVLTTKSILHNLIVHQHDASMLTSTDAMLMTPLYVLCCNLTVTNVLIQMLKATQPHASSMRNVMNKTPLMMLVEAKSEKCSAFHVEDGQLLPLVGLLEQRLDIDALEMIISASSNDMLFALEVHINDETSDLLPFMYGTLLGNCGLDVVYELAMKQPDLLTRIHQESNDNHTVNKESKKRNTTDSSNIEYMSSSEK